jgi:hypothetical protein
MVNVASYGLAQGQPFPQYLILALLDSGRGQIAEEEEDGRQPEGYAENYSLL